MEADEGAMKLIKAHVQNYRSIKDSGEFEIERIKTILVGPNEAGKTALLQALQHLNPPDDVKPFNALRDYPRALYNDIATGRANPKKIPVVKGWFELEADDLAAIPEMLRVKGQIFEFTRTLGNDFTWGLSKPPAYTSYGGVKVDLLRLAAHLDRDAAEDAKLQSAKLAAIVKGWGDDKQIFGDNATKLLAWLEAAIPLIDEDNERENERRKKLYQKVKSWDDYVTTLSVLKARMPKFVLFSNIFRVRPNIHLGHLAARTEAGNLDDEYFDYGNNCLLKLLGFSARQLSDLGKAEEPGRNDAAALERYREQLDNRKYQLNAASIRLSKEIREVWNPNQEKGEASKLKLEVDGQYLKVVVEDSEGVEVELDQRSEGFQWLVSFFVVFFSEADSAHANTVLLLDEPGVSLHAIKQREFRETVSKLAEKNQTIYTTHSPFLVGPDELDIVRVVEMVDRNTGTKVHTSVTSTDPAALLPLQEALGYDLAQSLFSNQRNLICEGLTDYWYVEATSALLGNSGLASLNDKIALVPSNTASKVVYFATILTSHNLKVAALLDSDNAGDQAANQEVLVHRLGAKRILRTADYTTPKIQKAEIEDLLRHTLVQIAKADLGIDALAAATAAPDKPLVDILAKVGGQAFSKYKLAKAYVRWTRDHTADDLTEMERAAWAKLLTAINSALK
jgi:predicted ATPase|tara:strand:- start:37772 stop:39808 length:2037 start_codon:yes stop_codon:yes gene_type:complete